MIEGTEKDLQKSTADLLKQLSESNIEEDLYNDQSEGIRINKSVPAIEDEKKKNKQKKKKKEKSVNKFLSNPIEEPEKCKILPLETPEKPEKKKSARNVSPTPKTSDNSSNIKETVCPYRNLYNRKCKI